MMYPTKLNFYVQILFQNINIDVFYAVSKFEVQHIRGSNYLLQMFNNGRFPC
jgi:hypothetical protein